MLTWLKGRGEGDTGASPTKTPAAVGDRAVPLALAGMEGQQLLGTTGDRGDGGTATILLHASTSAGGLKLVSVQLCVLALSPLSDGRAVAQGALGNQCPQGKSLEPQIRGWAPPARRDVCPVKQ